MSDDEGRYTVIIVPDDAERTRSFQVGARVLRLAAALAGGGVLLIAVLLGSWWYFAAQAARVPDLEREIARLRADSARVGELARTLDRVQGEYDKIRTMLGADILASSPMPEAMPANATAAGQAGAQRTGLSPEIPTSWPLATPGFVTQAHGARQAELGPHPGLDIAVAQDSYIRASGAGVVLEAGADSVYGLYVLIEHGSSGYRSMYGHASRLFVASGDSVRQNEVIALSGNTGRSTAPHLHFEILQDGNPVDPLTLVQQRANS